MLAKFLFSGTLSQNLYFRDKSDLKKKIHTKYRQPGTVGSYVEATLVFCANNKFHQNLMEKVDFDHPPAPLSRMSGFNT